MNVNRVIRVKGRDATGTLRSFLSKLWVNARIDAMLVPMEHSNGSGTETQIIRDSNELAGINPYSPIMLSNITSIVGKFLQEHKNKRLAILLRPCELRALIELQKRSRLIWQTPKPGNNKDWLLTIGVDCPGTLSPLDYAHLLAVEGSQTLSQRALSVGQKDGFKTKQFRLACQICDSPIPYNADITIGTIGIEGMTQQMLVIAFDESIDGKFHLDQITERIASEEEVVIREEEAGKITNSNALRREGFYGKDGNQFDELCNLLALFSRCTLCADCLDACPLYEGELTGMLGISSIHQQESPLFAELVSVGRWLASCCGCGMCQQACTSEVALTHLIAGLSHRIREELNYVPGHPEHPLPWRVANRAAAILSQQEGLNAIS